MKNKNYIFKFQLISSIFVSVLGTFLHFAYDLSGQNQIVSIISAVNESTWEHLKLLFFPMLFSTIIGYFLIGKGNNNFLCSKTIGIIISLLFIIVFFYTYTGILGFNVDVLNILSFFMAVILGEYIGYILMINNFSCNKYLTIFILCLLTFLFIFFTFNTPQIALFKDPITLGYGIN